MKKDIDKHAVEKMVRILQFLFSVIVIACVGGAFPNMSANHRDYKLTSDSFNLLLITSFCGMLYAGSWIVGTFCLKMAPLKIMISTTIDSGLTILYFVGGVASAITDYVKECKDYGELVRCATIKTAVAFSFFAFLVFGISAVYGLYVLRATYRKSASYGEAHTPRDENTNADYGAHATPVTSKVEGSVVV